MHFGAGLFRACGLSVKPKNTESLSGKPPERASNQEIDVGVNGPVDFRPCLGGRVDFIGY